MQNKTILDAIVIGGGQAGLAAGYHLKKSGLSFLILEEHQSIGDSWRNRYDSLVLFSSRAYSSLAGKQIEGDQNTYPTKNDVADYLEAYAKEFSLSIELSTKVTKVEKADSLYTVTTNNRKQFTARNIIVATGPFQIPSIPPFAKALSSDIVQFHSSEYLRPNQLPQGEVLVVGDGNSGRQVALELAQERTVYLAIGGRKPIMPQRLLGKDIFWWMEKVGLSKATIDSRVGQFFSKRDPIIGLNLSIKAMKKQGVVIKPLVKDCTDIQVQFADNTNITPNSIIWATGFRPDFQWLHLPEILDNRGNPIHKRGITSEKGIFFVGMPWQYTRGSALLLSVSEDAKYIVDYIQKA